MSLFAKRSFGSNWFVLRPRLTTAWFLFFLTLIIGIIADQRYQIIKENREKEIQVTLESVELRLNQLLKNTQNIALTLALTIDASGLPKNFEQIADDIMQANPNLQAIQLVPDGIIKYVYPIKGNERAIGYNLFGDKYNAMEANKAIELKEMYFQGPVKLLQGGDGVVGRLPLYLNNKFWGFSAVVIKLGELLKAAGIERHYRDYYQFQFSKINPMTGKEEFFIEGNTDFKNKIYSTRSIKEGNWKIYLTDTRLVYIDFQLGSLVVLGILLSILSSYLLLRLLNNQAKLFALVASQGDLLLTTESKYKTIFDHADIGIGRINSVTGEFLEANAFLCKLLGYTATELTHKKIKTLIHEDDLAADAQNFKRLRNNEIRQFSSIRRYVNRNQETIWTNAIVSPLWGDGEKPSQHIIIVEDISQQVAYEEQLIASKKRTEELINSIEGIVWEVDLKANFANTFISNKVEEILGYTPEEWANEPHINRVYEPDRAALKEYLATKLYEQKRHVYEYRMKAKNGTIVWVRDIVTVEPNLERPEMLRGIMIDITSLKEAEETLHKSYQLVNEQNKRLLNFSYIVSHNLRSHASNIDGISALISNAETDEERNEMLQLLRKVVVNLNDTLYNLNHIVNIQTNINLVKEPLNLLTYVNNALRTQEAQILSKNAQIINHVADDIYVYFNKAYLESVLLNLISNALRYSHVLRQPVIEINAKVIGSGCTLSIKDNGVGMDLNKNGDKLFGLNQTFHGNSDARGFGLFITKNQIEAMGDRIAVESELGVGTTFTIMFT